MARRASAPTEQDAYQTLAEIEQEGKLSLRVFGSVDYRFGDDDPASRLLDLKSRFTGAYFRPYAVKLYADDVPEAQMMTYPISGVMPTLLSDGRSAGGRRTVLLRVRHRLRADRGTCDGNPPVAE
ncbi:MAG: hypothetical protein IH930_11440 [Proteobacteria bacterium]|nr:hypothetical protein [Pseudomonadota bacterium]